MTEVGIRKILRPPVQNPGQGGSLPTPRREVPFQDEYQGNVALGSKVRHVLGNDRPAFRPGGRGDLRIISRPQAGLSDMDGVPAIVITQKFSSGCREHLIDQEPRHARSDSRCRAIARLRSAMFRLRSMSSRTSSTCSAA